MANDSAADGLRRALARAGVPIFVRGRADGPSSGGVRVLLHALAVQTDARLVSAIPCLIVRWPSETFTAIEAVADRLDSSSRQRLGLLHRCARALAISRAPDLEFIFGRADVLAPLALEPQEFPDPETDFGERFIAVAKECDETGLIGDVEDTFDTWLRQLEVDASITSNA